MAETWDGEAVRATFESVKNWGRWGPDDERGAINLITPEKLVEAAATVTVGEQVSCAHELAVMPAADNPFPAMHHMVRGGDDCVMPGLGAQFTSDFVGVAFHGMATSHIDALCHCLVDEQMYNGFGAAEVKSTGARRGSVMNIADGITSRGVLLDIAHTRGVEWLEPGHFITVADLEAAEEAAATRVGVGDVLLIGTGRDARRQQHGAWHPFADGLAGLHVECVPWLRDRDVAVLGCDGVSDALPGLGIEEWAMPIHQCTLVAMGVHLLDNLRLDRLSDACRRHGRWEFLFTVAPLRVDGGTGSPCNPIAVL